MPICQMLKFEYPDRHRMLTTIDFMWLPPLFHEVGWPCTSLPRVLTADLFSPGQDPVENAKQVAETTGHQRSYEMNDDWVTIFRDFMSDLEWERLHQAFEKVSSPLWPCSAVAT